MYTDYKGLVVPLDIIRRMREVEGAGTNWEKRGVEIQSEEAWMVLSSWYEATQV